MFGDQTSVEIDEHFCFGTKVQLILKAGVQILTQRTSVDKLVLKKILLGVFMILDLNYLIEFG